MEGQNCSNIYYKDKFTATGLLWFLLFAMPLITLFGIIGNIISFAILKNSATKNVGHFYLVCLSVFDTLTLLTIIYSFYMKVVLYPILTQNKIYSRSFYLLLHKYAACPFRLYATFTMRQISTWTIVIFSIDRLFSVMCPLRSRIFSTVKNSIIVISLLVVMSVLVNVPWIFGYHKTYDHCHKIFSCKANRVTAIMTIVEFVFLTVIPSLIICVCNVTIVYLLRKRQKHSTLVSKKEAMNQEKIITIRLLLVSTAFVVLTLPSLITISIHTENKLRGDLSYKSGSKADAFQVGLFLFTVNLSINFLLYCLTGVNFRRAAWSILCCRFDKLRYYRKIILNLTTDKIVTGGSSPGLRSGSISSNKTITKVDMPFKTFVTENEKDEIKLGLRKNIPDQS